MATRKNASKKTSRAKFNFNIDEDDIKKSKKSGSKLTKSLGILAVVFLVIGVGLGIGAGFYLCRNDCFEIIGLDELTLTIGENYYDEGCKVVSFGRDISDEVEIETDLIINPDGSLTGDDTKTYYILYKSNDIKYGKVFTVTKIRLITFVEEPEQDEIDSANDSTTNNENQEDNSQTNNNLENFQTSNELENFQTSTDLANSQTNRELAININLDNLKQITNFSSKNENVNATIKNVYIFSTTKGGING